MNHIPYEERRKTYTNALIAYGDRAQMIVAVEELAECQQAICKILRGGENFDHLAEEVADATIMLEQLRQLLLQDQGRERPLLRLFPDHQREKALSTR